MLTKLFNRTASPKSTDGLSQSGREAIIDLLHYALYADKRLSDAEDKFVDSYVDSLTWESGTSVEIYVNQSLGKVREYPRTEEGCAEFMQGVAARLSSPAAKAKALKLLQALISADGTVDAEDALLAAAKKALR